VGQHRSQVLTTSHAKPQKSTDALWGSAGANCQITLNANKLKHFQCTCKLGRQNSASVPQILLTLRVYSQEAEQHAAELARQEEDAAARQAALIDEAK